jgi:hypothetical protein
MAYLRLAVLLILAQVWLAACATGAAHENFVTTMGGQVGRSASDPNISINRYRERRGSVANLASGNAEQHYRFGPRCDVYFEIDRTSQKVVGWRYVGNKDDCAIVP